MATLPLPNSARYAPAAPKTHDLYLHLSGDAPGFTMLPLGQALQETPVTACLPGLHQPPRYVFFSVGRLLMAWLDAHPEVGSFDIHRAPYHAHHGIERVLTWRERVWLRPNGQPVANAPFWVDWCRKVLHGRRVNSISDEGREPKARKQYVEITLEQAAAALAAGGSRV